MRTIFRKNIYRIFWIMVLLGSIAVIFNLALADMFFKPLLMPVLMAAVFLRTAETRGRIKIILALFFSFCGDVFLLFENKEVSFFIGGLICFLIAHLFYISYFLQIKQSGDSPAKKYPYLLFLIVLYTGGLLYLLWPNLGELKIPVVIYACIISTMFYLSLCVPYKLGRIVRQLFIVGAIFFVVSDSLLAINKFYKQFITASILIRLTYCLAQYFIVKGFIRKRY